MYFITNLQFLASQSSFFPKLLTKPGTIYFQSLYLSVLFEQWVAAVKTLQGPKQLHTLRLISEVLGCLEFPMYITTGSQDLKDFLRSVHAGTVAWTTEIPAVLRRESKCRVSDHFTATFAVNEGWVLPELGTAPLQQVLHTSLYVLTYSERNLGILHIFMRLLSDGGVFVRFLKGVSFLQSMLKTVNGRFALMKVLFWSGIAIFTAFEDIIWLHSFPVVTCLIKRDLVIAHILRATGNMIGFEVQTKARAFMASARAGIVISTAELMAP